MKLKQRIGLLVVLPAAFLFGACNDGTEAPDPSPKPSPPATHAGHTQTPAPTFTGKVVRVTVAGGKAEVAERTVEVTRGETIRIEVVSDVDDELHVHGYDLKTAVTSGQTSVLELVAAIPGTFEVELERSKLDLFRLTVT
ncbi:MAG TPA: hypothetical protein VND22_05290 [Actinomycetota bacterium]|nr:hypothetical protein [Actinomycetota bacterium]